mmetsp:Transcript_751/g.1787  ORF Transcript_751/g.1787 Transcript_751/m.1787 type:complete len:259 (-) Transcript_751:1318-2094(-)
MAAASGASGSGSAADRGGGGAVAGLGGCPEGPEGCSCGELAASLPVLSSSHGGRAPDGFSGGSEPRASSADPFPGGSGAPTSHGPAPPANAFSSTASMHLCISALSACLSGLPNEGMKDLDSDASFRLSTSGVSCEAARRSLGGGNATSHPTQEPPTSARLPASHRQDQNAWDSLSCLKGQSETVGERRTCGFLRAERHNMHRRQRTRITNGGFPQPLRQNHIPLWHLWNQIQLSDTLPSKEIRSFIRRKVSVATSFQ